MSHQGYVSDPESRVRRIFGYEAAGGRTSSLFRDSYVPGLERGNVFLDRDFDEWRVHKRRFEEAEVAGSRWVKLSDHGRRFLAETHPDGSFTETALLEDGAGPASGTWVIDGQGILVFTLGQWRLSVIADSRGYHSGIEFGGEHGPVYFRVFKVA